MSNCQYLLSVFLVVAISNKQCNSFFEIDDAKIRSGQLYMLIVEPGLSVSFLMFCFTILSSF